MEITLRDLMTVIHGMLFGIFFVMVIFGLVIALCRHMFERGEPRVTDTGLKWEVAYLIVMAALGWAAVLSGAYIVYPWYRAIPPTGVTNLAQYPQFFLKSSPTTAGWHSFGMEWKEHIAWMAPIVVTMAAYVLAQYRGHARGNRRIRATVLAFALVALVAAGVAGGFGALIDKAAPVSGGPVINLMQGTK